MAAAPARAESQVEPPQFLVPAGGSRNDGLATRVLRTGVQGRPQWERRPGSRVPSRVRRRRFSKSDPVAREGDEDGPPEKESPWNLRTRRGQVKDQGVSREERGGHVRTVRLRSEDAERRERPAFSVSLTREEIDEDVYALTGARARRRPKKRPRSVQKQLDMLSPGSWLSEITVDSYKVPDSWLERR
ncbi:uncharacterized protein A4U43_C06F11100 [Asparagus officinalis]|uniref:DUF1639 family protein n=1 Tax=Asparagus officinalis TaxID=4686 RepID=A0A5P1ELP8_ASPOF|nr:uncharacterized protein LOC109845991 [Asparagus officinalis]ONK66704.1 uncharacterized protein A4U43_C06F11100 [Asparagus officinalis]